MQALEANSEFDARGIAIVGIGCILPGGIDSPETLWQALCEGRDAITEVPADRWNLDAVYDPDPGTPGRTTTRWGGFLENIAAFDAGLFGISPREAAVMDPQQRLLLESAWRALEDAGIPLEQIAGSATGVFIGISHSDYHGIQKFGRYEIDLHTATGGALSIAANRISHRFDLRGPSLAIDTACSSSLVALDLACHALSRGECEMALLGGVNAMLTPDVTITFSRASMLSPDGRCKAFDARANGYVRGEGAGVIVLKPLARALADGDDIYAVIRATAVNQDGRTSTITVPSLAAQVTMLRAACRQASIDPEAVRYVEAHGTGTAVGDPIEAEAIGTVFGARGAGARPCLIGSIKSNIGHLEPAAGVAGLIKAALCVNRGSIPPSIHFETINPNIRAGELGIEVCRRLTAFPQSAGPRLAAVNSFGFGGTNACAIVQQPPSPQLSQIERGGDRYPVLLPLSATSEALLQVRATQLAQFLATQGADVADAAATLAMRRSHLPCRAVVIARDADQATMHLRMLGRGERDPDIILGRRGNKARTAFVFTGQGAHWWAMGRGLLETDAVFAAAVEECDAVFQGVSGWSIVAELKRDQATSRIDQTIVAQPATFALQVGLAARWKAWGIEPDAVIGHSIGEMAAAFVARTLSLEDAIAVVYHRSRLQEHARFQGGMAAVGLKAEDARKLLRDRQFALEIAAINAPELVTIGGPGEEIDRLVAALTEEQVFARRLQVDYAFHTRQMEPFEPELRRSLAGIGSHRGDIAMYSTVTGEEVAARELNADYWWRNMREPVQFRAAVDAAIADGYNAFIELGAHPVLAGPVRDCLAARGQSGFAVASLNRAEVDQIAMSRALAELHVNGAAINWPAAIAPDCKFVRLPGLPLEKTSFWAEAEESRAARLDGPAHPLLGYRSKTSAPRWQAQVGPALHRFLGDHKVDGSVVFPAAGYVELMLAAAREALGEAPWELEAISFHDALVLGAETIAVLETSVDLVRQRIELCSRMRGEDMAWTLRASARIRAWRGPDPVLKVWHPKIDPPGNVEHLRFYKQLRYEGHDFGPAFRGVKTLWREHGEVLGLVTLPVEAGTADRYVLHPALLDACFQLIRGFRKIDDEDASGATLALPVQITRLRFFRRPGTTVFGRVSAVKETSSEIVSDIAIMDEAGRLVALIEGFTCQRVSNSKQQLQAQRPAWYKESWIALADAVPAAATLNGQTWLFLADEGGVAARLAALVEERGGRAVMVDCVPDAGVLPTILRDIAAPIDHIVDLWPLRQAAGSGARHRLAAAQAAGLEALIALVQFSGEQAAQPRISVVTAGAVLADGDAATPDGTEIVHAGLVAAARTVANEYAGLAIRCIDVDTQDCDVGALFAELSGNAVETEVVLRGSKRFAGRLERTSADVLPLRGAAWAKDAHAPPFHITMTAPGIIDNLILREITPRSPGAGEVLVEVHAVGLNFRDVMAATGLLPPEAEDEPAWQHLGFEGAGVVTAIGAGVDAALLGRRVVAVSRGCFASHVVVPAALAFPISDNLSFETAAALPTAYVTARYALVTLGRIRKGETVLIHAATGGVGLAAVAIARRQGANVIATAGNPAKRDELRKRGIAHVFDSRSLSFADDVMRVTEGRGVDLVLNSLPGPFLEKSLAVLAHGGRFLEIGKRDIYADTPIGMRNLRQNVAFFAIDLARLAAERPELVREEARAVLQDLDSRQLEALPVEHFALDDVAGAFRRMAMARHIGKIVVSFEGPARVELNGTAGHVVRPDATYLVTGGLGGFGLQISQWLVAQGARMLVLLGRNGAATPEAAAALDGMRSVGAEVTAVAADVTDRDALQKALSAIAATDRPLGGIIHAAGVIDDALIRDLDAARIRRVVEPKVLGAWHLHELTVQMRLDFFVCVSSVSATLGSIGQAHYAAANRSLDALALLRRAQGLPALSIAWGPIADAGYLTRHPEVARQLAQMGVRPMSGQEALAGLGTLLRRDCGAIAHAELHWPALARANPTLCATPRLSAHVASDTMADASGSQLRARLLDLPEAARAKALAGFVLDQIGTVLKLPMQSIDPDRPMAELGLDSLTSFELKNRVETALGISLPVGKFLQRPTLNILIDAISQKLDEAGTSISENGSASDATAEPAMSIGQEALWYVDRFAPGSPAYSLAMCIAVRPQLNQDLADAAFRRVIARHDGLRLTFPADASGPVPGFLDAAEFEMVRHSAVHMDERTFRDALDLEGNRPFDLGHGPLVRLHLFRRADCDVLLLQVHHIVADAASIVIAVGEMFEIYFAMEAAGTAKFARPAMPVAAFANWQRRMADGPEGQAHAAYWRAQLAGAPDLLSLPTDFPRPSAQRGPGASRNIVIPTALGLKLKQIAKQQSQTLFTVLLSTFSVLLHRLSGDADIVIGTPTLGRVNADFAEAVGYFVNPVPIRTRLDNAEHFNALLAQVGDTVRAALEHQEFPFARIVRDLDLPRDSSRSPVFQAMFAMERPAELDAQGFAATLLNTEGASIEIRGLKIESMPLRRDRAQFDLTFVMEEFQDQIIGVVDYRTDLWQTATIDRFIAHFIAILEAIAQSSDVAICELAIGCEAGQPLIGPQLPNYPDVIEAIHAAVAARPSRVAVESSNGSWTYRQLADRFMAVAAALTSHGVGRQSLVGICMARSGDLVAALLGVLEIGAAYVPLDISHPPARLSRVLADTEPNVIIADDRSAMVLSNLIDCPIVTLDEIAELKSAEYVHFGKHLRNASDLAYVIHTSGSTGGPIGVEVRRDAVSSFLAAMALELPLSADDSLLAVTTIAFDIAVLELLLPLTLGGRVVLADDVVARDGRRLSERLAKGDITVMQGTPATWQLLISAGWKGHPTFKALVGGERLQRGLADDLLQRAGGLWNLYGPTETTVWSTCTQVFAGAASVPIGQPIANTKCYVVDEQLRQVPVGVPGELLIAGAGVARGYRHRPELTKARFIADPFDPTGASLCFRTGDIVRQSENGLLYNGRRDQQIKVRGHRIELGEIEAALGTHPAVREAAAVLHDGDLEKARIGACVVLHPDQSADPRALASHLKQILPSFMLPTSIAVIPAMPRLPNGKIDRARLAAMAEAPVMRHATIKPRHATDEKLAALLAEILDVGEVGIEDDFFALGGTSLLAMRYLARVSEAFQIDLGPTDLLRAPTVASMADLIGEGRPEGTEAHAGGGAVEAAAIRSMWRPLALARAEGAFADIDGAAIAYLPDDMARLAVSHARLARSVTSEPYWVGACRLSLGTIALIVAPLGGRELFADAAATRATLNGAVEYAARLGARCVALTGLIPAATDLGLGLTAPDGIALSHGHAATASAVVLTMASAARAAGRDLTEETLCCVGLGAIGTATLRSALTSIEHPRALMLCDVPAKRDYLEALAHEIRVTLGFRGEIDIATQAGALPDKAYQSRFFVGATNVPNVIEVDRLRPGSLVVDDSFPLCFDFAAALRRFNASGDVLCVAGGSVRMPEAFRWELSLPPGVPALLRDGGAQAMLPPDRVITGCILSSLLPQAAGLPATLGRVTTAECGAYWHGFARLNIEAAPLHCGSWTPTQADLARFSAVTGAGGETVARRARRSD